VIRGFLKGVIWGGIVTVAGLGVVSQIAAPPVVVTASPTGTDLDTVAAPEPLPKAPEAEVQPEILQKGPEAEDAGAVPADPSPATQSAGDVGAATSEFEAVAPDPAAAEDPATTTDETAQADEVPEEMPPAQPPLEVDATAPDAPGGTDLQEEAGGLPAALDETRPGLVAPDAMPSPQGEDAPDMAEAPPAPPVDDALLQPAPAPQAEAAPALVVPEEPAPSPTPAPAQADTGPGLEPDAGIDVAVPEVETDRLPRIGDEAEPPAAAVPEELAVIGTTPLELFSREFDNPEGKPLFSIILIDEGTPAQDRESLAALPFPMTFAIDPLAPDSAEAARVYRAAGQEVAMLAAGIPAGATAGDLEQTFQALDMALPEAVVVLDRPEGTLQEATDLARAVVPIVAEQGRGILTYERGLNPADQVARREGVPSAVIFRVLDSEGESIPKMRNYLDRAAFKAAQEGHVVVIGRTRPETVAAILEWTVEGRAASVALAPVSAVLEGAPTP